MVASLLLALSPADLTARIVVFAALVICSALFSAAEAALLSVPAYQRPRLDESERSTAVHRLIAHPNRMFVTVLVGNYIVNVAAAALAAQTALALVSGAWGVAIAVAVGLTVVALLTLGELIPRAIATVSPRETARNVAPFVVAAEWVLRPLVWPFEVLSRFIFRAFGAPRERRVFLDDQDLKRLVEIGRAQGLIEKQEEEMIAAVIDLPDVNVGEIMVPRVDVIGVSDEMPSEMIVDGFAESGYSRLPVYHDSLDNVLGVVYAKDLLKALREGQKATAKDLMRPAVFVPETMPLDEVLNLMRTKGVHLIMVHDEFGGTAGIVAMEDVLEEIVGEIYDEYDARAATVEWVDEATALLDARMSVEEANKALGADLPVDQGYETLGGYLFHRLGRPGRVGEIVRHDGYEYKLERVIGRRIVRVRATKVREPSDS